MYEVEFGVKKPYKNIQRIKYHTTYYITRIQAAQIRNSIQKKFRNHSKKGSSPLGNFAEKSHETKCVLYTPVWWIAQLSPALSLNNCRRVKSRLLRQLFDVTRCEIPSKIIALPFFILDYEIDISHTCLYIFGQRNYWTVSTVYDLLSQMWKIVLR